jgi:hypothetical protein
VLTLRFESDFADLFEVRGQIRERRGETTRLLLSNRVAALRYCGLDGVVRVMTARFTPAPARLEESWPCRTALILGQVEIFIEFAAAWREPIAESAQHLYRVCGGARSAICRTGDANCRVERPVQ